MNTSNCWEVDARVLEPGDRFKPLHDSLWHVAARILATDAWILGQLVPCVEVLCCVDEKGRAHRWQYLTLESGRKVVVPVLPKSL